jgi:hypothetical protein
MLRDNTGIVGSGVRCGLCRSYIWRIEKELSQYHKEGYVLRKLQRGLSAIETWYERWNIKINEDKAQAIYFSRRLRSPEALLH